MSKDGVLLIDKQAEQSSALALTLLKSNLEGVSKIGHAGTLDPFATGLLIILLGRATRLADYFQAGDKTYSGQICLGISTDTDDVTGETLEVIDDIPEFERVHAAALAMLGNQQQQPPRFSARRVDGKRAYKLARKGREFILEPRNVTLSSLEIEKFDSRTVNFRMVCSKGYYVRAFARDLGNVLGCGACLKTLRREGSSPFDISMAKSLENTSLSDVIPWDRAIKRIIGRDTPINDIGVEDSEFLALKNGLVPHSLNKRSADAMDSSANALLVYRRQSDGVAGGLLSRTGEDLSIALNM